MKLLKILSISLLLSLGISISACSADTANEKKTGTADDKVKDIQTEVEDKRIVAGTVASMLYLDYLEVDLAGTVNTSGYLPERYKDTPTIGLPMSPNSELTLALEPDIFIAEKMLEPVVTEILEPAENVEVIYLSGSSYQSIADNISILCERLEIEGKEEEIRNILNEKIQEAKKIAEGKEAPVVAILFGTPDSFSFAGSKSFAGDVLNIIGGKNMAELVDLGSGYVNLDREVLAKTDPDIILRLSHGGADMIEETKKSFDEAYKEPYWQGLKAVQNNRVYDLDPVMFGVTVNMNSIEAPVELAKLIYGEE